MVKVEIKVRFFFIAHLNGHTLLRTLSKIVIIKDKICLLMISQFSK